MLTVHLCDRFWLPEQFTATLPANQSTESVVALQFRILFWKRKDAGGRLFRLKINKAETLIRFFEFLVLFWFFVFVVPNLGGGSTLLGWLVSRHPRTVSHGQRVDREHFPFVNIKHDIVKPNLFVQLIWFCSSTLYAVSYPCTCVTTP